MLNGAENFSVYNKLVNIKQANKNKRGNKISNHVLNLIDGLVVRNDIKEFEKS